MSILDNLRRSTGKNDDCTHNILDLLDVVPDIEEKLACNPIIIDIGAAHGLLVEAFRKGGFANTCGFDANPRFSEEFLGIVETANATKLPLENESVDIAISSRLFSDPGFYLGKTTRLREIIPGSDISRICNRVITEVARVLKLGGVYLISDDYLIPIEEENRVFFEIIHTHMNLGEILKRTNEPYPTAGLG